MNSNSRKFTILSFALLSMLCGYVFYLILTQVADWTKVGGSNVFGTGFGWNIVGGSTASLLGLCLFMGLCLNSKATSFVDEVFLELERTTWPTPKDTARSTVVVTCMVAAAALVLALMDVVWDFLFRNLL